MLFRWLGLAFLPVFEFLIKLPKFCELCIVHAVSAVDGVLVFLGMDAKRHIEFLIKDPEVIDITDINQPILTSLSAVASLIRPRTVSTAEQSKKFVFGS